MSSKATPPQSKAKPAKGGKKAKLSAVSEDVAADASPTTTADVDGLARAARSAEFRMRAGRALKVLAPASIAALGFAAAVLCARKLAPESVSDTATIAMLACAGSAAVLAVLVTALRKLPPDSGAIALDAHHNLNGRVANALAFSRVDAAKRNGMMAAAIEDACVKATQLEPRRAVRIVLPPELLVALALAGLVAVIALFEVPILQVLQAPARMANHNALEMSDDDLALFKEAAAQLTRDEQSPEVKAAIERFNQLIEDIANRRLNRMDAFRRMQEIENDLLKGAAADKEAFDEALKSAAKELEKSELMRPSAEAMR